MRLNPNIKFPVYPVGGYRETWTEFNRTYIETDVNTYILDDRNKSGDLPVRRLQILADIKYRKEMGYEFTPIYPLRRVIKTEDQLIAYLVKHKCYVDHSGNLFKHAPTTFYKLTYHKVLRAAVSPKGHTLLFLKGINTPIKINKAPSEGSMWAGVLRLPRKNILYELSKVKKPDTKRKL